MNQITKEKITIEVASYIQRVLEGYAIGQLTGQFVFEVHLSQGGLAHHQEIFKERLK